MGKEIVREHWTMQSVRNEILQGLDRAWNNVDLESDIDRAFFLLGWIENALSIDLDIFHDPRNPCTRCPERTEDKEGHRTCECDAHDCYIDCINAEQDAKFDAQGDQGERDAKADRRYVYADNHRSMPRGDY